MQAQTMSKVPPSQPSILPPLQNLPSWSRSSLERRKQPRSIVRDPQQTINPLEETEDNGHETTTDYKKSLSPPCEPRIVSAPSRTGEKDLKQKVSEMEKSLDFVQHEHAQVLRNLHDEIERLKAENKDLNFKLVMSRSGVNVEDISPAPSEEIVKYPNSTNKSTKEKQSSGRSKTANKEKHYKTNISSDVENTKKEPKQNTETKQNTRNSSSSAKKRQPSGSKDSVPTPPGSARKPANSLGSGKSKFLSKARAKQLEKEQTAKAESPIPTPQSPIWSSIHGGQQMIMVTLSKDQIIQVHVPSETGPRSPTLSECKTIIAEQHEVNYKQARELLKLRTDLRDAILTQKLSQTKSYPVPGRIDPSHSHSNISGSNLVNNRHLPQLPYREPVNSGRLPPRLPNQPEKFSLPSLRPNINSGVADRRRRQQAILRSKVGRRDLY